MTKRRVIRHKVTKKPLFIVLLELGKLKFTAVPSIIRKIIKRDK